MQNRIQLMYSIFSAHNLKPFRKLILKSPHHLPSTHQKFKIQKLNTSPKNNIYKIPFPLKQHPVQKSAPGVSEIS